jgi:hypothetical protein
MPVPSPFLNIPALIAQATGRDPNPAPPPPAVQLQAKDVQVHKSHPNAHSLYDLSQAMKAAPSSTTFTVAPDVEPAFNLMILSPTLGRSDGKGTIPNPHYNAKKVVVDSTMPAGTWKLS